MDPLSLSDDQWTAARSQYLKILARTDSAEGALAYIELVHGYYPFAHHQTLVRTIWQAMHDHQDTLILMPAGAAKTTYGTTGMGSWAVSMFPDIRIGLMSQTDDFAADFSSSIMATLEQNEVQHELFGDISHGSKWRIDAWRRKGVGQRILQSKDMTLVSGGTGGQIASKRFDVILADDVLGKDNTATPDQRKKTRDWWDKVLIPRRVADGVTINYGTRWTEDDLYQTLMDEYAFRTVIIKALIEVDDPDEGTRNGWVTAVGPEGKLFRSYWESQYPVKTLIEWRRRNPANFDCVYQQDVEGLMSGELFQLAWYLQPDFFYDELPTGHRYTTRQGGDLAASTKQRADFTATVIVSEDWCGGGCPRNGHYYVGYEERDKIGTEHMEWFAHRFYNRPAWVPQPAVLNLEKTAFQLTVVQEFHKDRADVPVVGVDADSDKKTRFSAVAEKYRMGMVHHHRSLRDGRLQRECVAWPKSHDDLMDALSHAMGLGGGTFFFGSIPRR